MELVSLFRQGCYSMDWVQDFYDQAEIWWGPDPDASAVGETLADTVERLCGPEPKRILELGAGSGGAAAAMADRGHTVVAVELCPARARQARELSSSPHKGSLTVLEADFYTVELTEHFDVVCYWDGFGIGSDADHRRLLRRVAQLWLAPAGCMLLDVANPVWAVRRAGSEQVLPPVEGVPGSVEMIRRFHFDPVQGRWIDEWQPTADPDKALAQTVRCYTPADLALLLEGTGLALERVEVEGQALDFRSQKITTTGPLMEAYSYLAQLAPAVGLEAQRV